LEETKMNELYNLGSQLRDILRGLLQISEPTGIDALTGGFAGLTDRRLRNSETLEGLSLNDFAEAKARLLRRDPLRVPGSLHFAATLAYGDFILADGSTIRCEGIPGISGVATSRDIQASEGDAPRVHLDRVITHFHFDIPSVLIEQNNSKSSIGTLIGASNGSVPALLPGKASFSQYLILTLEGRPLANREPLVMTADRVEEWPPIGSTFVSEAPTEFFELDQLSNSEARPIATLAKCSNNVVRDISVPELILPTR
jgi:hypothetical protein